MIKGLILLLLIAPTDTEPDLFSCSTLRFFRSRKPPQWIPTTPIKPTIIELFFIYLHLIIIGSDQFCHYFSRL